MTEDSQSVVLLLQLSPHDVRDTKKKLHPCCMLLIYVKCETCYVGWRVEMGKIPIFKIFQRSRNQATQDDSMVPVVLVS